MSRLKERVGLVGLAAFLVVDVVLVGLAVTSTRQPVAAGGARVGGGAAGSSATSTPSGSSTTTQPVSPAVEVVPLTVGLVAVTRTTALRFTTGSCADGGSELVLTRDGGESWDPRPAPFDTTARIRVRADKSAFAVGAAAEPECVMSIRQAPAFDGDFADPDALGDVWFRDPRRADSVGLPSGRTGRPCGARKVIDLGVVDSGAAVLCDDGRVLTSTIGSKWDRQGTVADGLALARTTDGRVVVAAVGIGDCDGVALVDAAEPGTALGCAAAEVADITPGSVAVSVTADSGWLVVGDDTYLSDRSLSTWTKS